MTAICTGAVFDPMSPKAAGATRRIQSVSQGLAVLLVCLLRVCLLLQVHDQHSVLCGVPGLCQQGCGACAAAAGAQYGCELRGRQLCVMDMGLHW